MRPAGHLPLKFNMRWLLVSCDTADTTWPCDAINAGARERAKCIRKKCCFTCCGYINLSPLSRARITVLGSGSECTATIRRTLTFGEVLFYSLALARYKGDALDRLVLVYRENTPAKKRNTSAYAMHITGCSGRPSLELTLRACAHCGSAKNYGL